jgi:transcriptional regulator with XRE-family HTH domain
MRPQMSDTAFADEFPRLLAERGLTLRAVARMVGVTAPHLSRAVRGADGKTPGPDLVARISVALGLPKDYFPEVREAEVLRAVRHDPQLRDRIYFSIGS